MQIMVLGRITGFRHPGEVDWNGKEAYKGCATTCDLNMLPPSRLKISGDQWRGDRLQHKH